jgi:hypothetical protein
MQRTCIYFSMCFPNKVWVEFPKAPLELYAVRRASQVFSIRRPFPSNGVLYSQLQLNILYSDPKGYEFLHMGDRCDPAPKCPNPGMVVKFMLHRSVLPSY